MTKKCQIQFASSRLASVVMCINLVGLFIGLILLSFFKVKIWHSVCKFIHSLKHLFFVNYRQKKNDQKANQKRTKNEPKTTQKRTNNEPKTTKKRRKNDQKPNQKRPKKRSRNKPKTKVLQK